MAYIKGGHDDFRLTYYLTSNAQQTSIFHLKQHLSTFLAIFENFKFSKFFDFGESPDPKNIFLQKFFGRFHLQTAFLNIFQKFQNRAVEESRGDITVEQICKICPRGPGILRGMKICAEFYAYSILFYSNFIIRNQSISLYQFLLGF